MRMGLWAAVALVVMAAGAVFCGNAFEAAMVQGARAAALEQENALLADGIAQLQRQRADVQAWEELLARAQGLRPEALRRYPILVDQETSWEETAAVLLIVSNAHPRPGGYRFQPERFSITRVGDDANATERYQLQMAGQFLSLEQTP
ncbi:hypothetical protein TDMWS_21600 [Thermodesulfomicrobium sp. WS]|nr:hypothetical protein TDMWS_21600 [Thermodesulfomicrobium sp. WS]